MSSQEQEFNYFKAQKAAIEMTRSGGDFLQCIGKAFLKADDSNSRKLYAAFKSDFDLFHGYAQERKHGPT